jgi:hypothetical protein
MSDIADEADQYIDLVTVLLDESIKYWPTLSDTITQVKDSDPKRKGNHE